MRWNPYWSPNQLPPRYLPELAALYAEQGVELRGCDKDLRDYCRSSTQPLSRTGTKSIWRLFWRSKWSPVWIEAIEHINRYSSQHTESIVTENTAHAERFMREVDSSSVMDNASTRFADGFEYGLGCRDRYFHRQDPRPRARGPRGSNQPEVGGLWRRADPSIICRSLFLGARLIRSTMAICE